MLQPTPPADVNVLLEFLYRLGQAYLACGEQTAIVESYLRQIAAVNGMRASRVVTFPTAVLVAIDDGGDEHITMAEGPTQSLRLDQIAEVYTLGAASQCGAINPADGLDRLREIRQMTPRFGPIGAIAGHIVLTIGLAIVQLPTIVNLTVALILGAVVGALKLVNRDRPILSAPLSVVSAAIVSVLVFSAVKQGLPVDPMYALVPPLVTFLPGAMLAFALVELTYGDMVSGSSRLVTGIVQLVLLAFGLTAGALAVGYAPDHLLDGPRGIVVPLWASLAGVVVFGIGVFIHFSAPHGSMSWILLVLFATFTAQRLAAGFVGAELSGFFGMLVATPLGNLIQSRFRGPPSMVTFLPSFWLLVPGVLGLISVKQMLVDNTGGAGLLSVVFALTAIALGTLVGESITKWLERSLDWWLQSDRDR
jgi:uncharacterized membrane protein YjjP (DUF1212 family)